jgi:hypothetical protein
MLLLPILLVILTIQREKNKNDGTQTMNPPRQQVCSPLVINVLLLTMTVEMKAMMRRNMRMTARMNLHHHKVHFPMLLPLTLMTGKMRPMMWKKRRLEMRTKHGFMPKYPDVQAPTATMNIHPHSGCHYKRNSGSTPAGMNNLHTRGPAGRQTPGGSPATAAPTTRQRPPSRTTR